VLEFSLKGSKEKRGTAAGGISGRPAGETDTGGFDRAAIRHALGDPWYTLHKQNDEGLQWGMTGYRHEIDAFVQK